MSESWTRREFLTKTGAAVAAIQTLDHLSPCCALAADGDSAASELFELKPVADGVYAAIAAPRYKVNSNAAVIVTNDGVVVVDSHSKPSAAFALYREIQSVTKLPVKKVVNTHFHWDHWQGNQAYKETFPDLEIVSSQRTLENLTRDGADNGGVSFIAKQLTTVPKEIEQLKAELRKARTSQQKARIFANIQQAEAYLEELKQMQPALPTRTFAETVTLNEGGREIQILQLGRAHTDGDVFIYLPQEKVVATGDALIDWMPFLADAYPEDWVGTLSALEQYDFSKVIPGHGEVAGRDQLAFFRGYLTDLIAAVKNGILDGANIDELKKTISDRLAPQYEKAMSKYPLGQYRDRIGLNVDMVYQKLTKKD